MDVRTSDTRLLKYAIEIGRQKSFTKAARNLHVAQPSLSQQIAKLENELNMTLFYRHHHAVIPTPDGVRFLERAEQVVRVHDDFIREMREHRGGIGSELTIGTPVITGGHMLPPILEAFHTRYPQVEVRLVEDSPQLLEESTAKGMTDLSILPLPVEDPRLATQIIGSEPILLAFPSEPKDWMHAAQCDHLLSSNGVVDISLSHLSLAPFILLKAGYGFRNIVLELCAESGFQPEVAYQTSSIEMAQSLVAHGLGITLIPAMVQRLGEQKRPRYFSLNENPLRTLAFVYRKDRYLSMAARAFLDLFQEMQGLS